MFKTSLGHAEAFRFMISPLIDMVSAKSRTSGVCVSTSADIGDPLRNCGAFCRLRLRRQLTEVCCPSRNNVRSTTRPSGNSSAS